MLRSAAALAMLSLCGCAATTATTEGILASDDMRAAILQNRAKYWKGPDSIRDARISRPFSCHGGLAHVVSPPNACICVEANARNSFGGYTGLKRYTFLFADLTLVDVLPPRSQDMCDPMAPFPEMNGGVTPAPAPAQAPRSRS